MGIFTYLLNFVIIFKNIYLSKILYRCNLFFNKFNHKIKKVLFLFYFALTIIFFFSDVFAIIGIFMGFIFWKLLNVYPNYFDKKKTYYKICKFEKEIRYFKNKTCFRCGSALAIKS